MKMRSTALWGLTALLSAGLMVGPASAGARASGSGLSAPPGGAGQEAAKKAPQWKSREEYDAFQAMAKETDPHKKIAAAEAVIQKYPNSEFKDAAYVTEMAAYQQLGDSDKAIDAAHKALQVNPDNLDALTFLSFAFPFVFKPDDSQATTKLADAETVAKHGLDVLQKLQKPANVTDQQFQEYVKPKRNAFNNALGFVALARKDYAAAIPPLQAAIQDNASDTYAFYRLGVAYEFSTPPDYDKAIWYVARAVSLQKASNTPDTIGIAKFLDQIYVGRHGSDQGESDVVTQAATSPEPPAGFKVSPPEKHAPTGNPNIDAFHQIQDSLGVGGDQAEKYWQSIKGQPLGLTGFVDSVEKGTDAGTYLVHIDITNESKAKDGVYDIELKDSSQPDVKELVKGDPLRFQGMISGHTETPSFVLTVDGKVNEDDLKALVESHKPVKKAPKHRSEQPQ
jgi:tetratricopeptide (TPR) repeat protein